MLHPVWQWYEPCKCITEVESPKVRLWYFENNGFEHFLNLVSYSILKALRSQRATGFELHKLHCNLAEIRLELHFDPMITTWLLEGPLPIIWRQHRVRNFLLLLWTSMWLIFSANYNVTYITAKDYKDTLATVKNTLFLSHGANKGI